MAPSTMFALGSATASTGFSLFGGKAFNTFSPTANPMTGVQALQEQATNTEVQTQNEQADIALSDAGLAAQQKATQVKQFRESQAIGYDGSGVLLEGSPMRVLDFTRQQGQQEVDAIINRGQSQAELLRQQAMITANQGRASILGQDITFGAQQAAARIQALSSSNRLPAALSSLGSVFGGLGGKTTTGPADPFANFTYGDPATGGLGMVP